jgi:hypothetical protein
MDRETESAGAPGEASAPAGDDGAAWAEVVARWDDDEAHRAYLARFSDLEGLAVAGRRYRAVLEARPDDAVAARFRDEVLKRATARALAALPRSGPVHPASRWIRWAGAALAGALLGAAVWLLVMLLRGGDR